jgi:hypothetical protein
MSDLIERLECALRLFQPRMDRQLLLDVRAALRSAAEREREYREALEKISRPYAANGNRLIYSDVQIMEMARAVLDKHANPSRPSTPEQSP